MAVFTAEDCSASRSPGRTLRRIDKLMSAYIETRVDGFDLSYMNWIALKVVRDRTVSNAGELARELGITSGATTRLIDVLEARGLMVRERGADRRVVHLAITEAGREMVAKVYDHVVGAWNDVVAEFTQEEAHMLADLLVKLLASVERVTGGATTTMEAAE